MEERDSQQIFLLVNIFWNLLVCCGLAAIGWAVPPLFGRVEEGRSWEKAKVLSNHQYCWLSSGGFCQCLIRPWRIKYSQNKQILRFPAFYCSWRQLTNITGNVLDLSGFCILCVFSSYLWLSVGSWCWQRGRVNFPWQSSYIPPSALFRPFTHTPSTYDDDEDVVYLDIDRFLTRQVLRLTHKEQVVWGNWLVSYIFNFIWR